MVKRILLIAMPFGTIKWPAMGISLLKSILRDESIPCDIRYFNILFAEMIGREVYEEISLFPQQMIGERLFAEAYYSSELPPAEAYRKFLGRVGQGKSDYLDEILTVKKFVDPFMERCMQSVSWKEYDIVGFTTMFEQNLASIALAHRIKRLDPSKIIVFGGANCEGEMGAELHRRFPFIDFVFNGEADLCLPDLVKRVSNAEPVDDICNLIHRQNGKTKISKEEQITTDLDALPYPNFDDYFSELKRSSFPYSVCEEIPMETSRGCWWGSKSQCLFCGLNGKSVEFRSKTEERAIQELRYLTEKYQRKYDVIRIAMVDNILDMKYFKGLLPRLKTENLPVQIFYETKANLNEEHVKTLAEAKVTSIQPGIESLNTHILKIMGKGVSALRNIQLLKRCQQFGVYPTWNIIYGFPGETDEDYREMTNIIEKILHLTPPDGVVPISLQRFSPYIVNSKKYGIENVRPDSAYQFIYPFDQTTLQKLAYFFEFDYRDDVKPSRYHKKVLQFTDYWRECFARNETLHSIESSPCTLVIEDGRSNAVLTQVVLESAQKDIYEYCDCVRSFPSILSHIQNKYSQYSIRGRDIEDFLEDMVNLNFMVNEDNKYLSLAIRLDRNFSTSYQLIAA